MQTQQYLNDLFLIKNTYYICDRQPFITNWSNYLRFNLKTVRIFIPVLIKRTIVKNVNIYFNSVKECEKKQNITTIHKLANNE